MDKSQIQTVLQSIHEIEQAECRIIHRKELHKHLPEDMPFEDKKQFIKSWQNTYFARLKNIGYGVKLA